MLTLKDIIDRVLSKAECKELYIADNGLYTIERSVDAFPLNPRYDMDHLGKLVTWHDRYILGEVDTDLSPSEFLQSLPSDAIVLNVYMREHSAIYLSCDSFNDPWDSGLVGFIYTTIEEALKWGFTSLDEVLKELRMEIDDYNHFMNTTYYQVYITDLKTEQIIGAGVNLAEYEIEDYIKEILE